MGGNTGGTELPIRLYDTPAGLIIACLCDAEAATVHRSSERAAPIIRAAHGTGAITRGLVNDMSPGGLLRMVLHAKTCLRGQNIARGAA